RVQVAPSARPSARRDQTCSPLVFRAVNHAVTRKSMGPDPSLHRIGTADPTSPNLNRIGTADPKWLS
ncbi:hypothetical protein LCL97_16890, partial [Seohaeicola saemankumensis]